MTGTQFPRVLVVSADCITSSSGTGVTLRNLFGDWPAERLCQVHLSNADSVTHCCGRISYPPGAVPADFLARKVLGGHHVPFATGAPRIAGVPLDLEAPRSARRHASLRALADLSPVLPSAHVDRLVSDFAPEVVYSLLGSVRVTRIAGRIARRAGASLVPHFMDDWLTTLYSSGELRGLARKQLLGAVGRALHDAPLAMCISSEMCAEYSKRLGTRCAVFVSPVECDAATPQPPSNEIVDFLYIGGLHLGRWQTLVLLAATLQRLGLTARLRVFAPAADLDSVVVPSVCRGVIKLCGTLPQDQVVSELQTADILVHVEAFDDCFAQYTRLSVSTKLPQYFAAGRPVLGVGPASLASIALIAQSGAGPVVTDPRPRSLSPIVEAIVSDAGARISHGKAAHAWALDHFSTGRTRARFRDALAMVAR